MSAKRGAGGVSLGLIVGLAACAGLEPVPDGADGLWRARRPGGGEQVRLELFRGPIGHRDTPRVRLYFDLDEIRGLDAAAFREESEPLEFTLERPAGRLLFTGRRARRPGGSFRFDPSTAFVERLARLGLDHGDRERMLELTIRGVSLDLVESLIAAGYAGGDTDDLLRLHDYGLDAAWATSMARLSGPPSVRQLLSLRHHGIQSRHVDRWIAAGIGDRDVDDLLRLHVRGFPPGDAARYLELGFDAIDDWLTFHRNGVPEALIAAVAESAAEDKGAEAIVRLYLHGVDAADVRAAAPLIAAGFDWDALIGFRRRGIRSEYAIELLDSGWDGIDRDGIARLAVNGLQTDWILRVRAASGNTLDVDDLVELGNHGVDAGDYEAYADLGYVDVDEVRTLVAQGVRPDWLKAVGAYFEGTLAVDDVVTLRNAGVDEAHLRRLAEAGFSRPDPDEVAEARRAGIERWIAANGKP